MEYMDLSNRISRSKSFATFLESLVTWNDLPNMIYLYYIYDLWTIILKCKLISLYAYEK